MLFQLIRRFAFNQKKPPFTSFAKSKPKAFTNANLTQVGALEELKNPKNYTLENATKIIKKLLALWTENKMQSRDWLQIPEVASSMKYFTLLVPSLNAEQTALLVRQLGNLGIKDEELWIKIEKHVTRKIFRDLTTSDIPYLIQGSARAGRSSDALWNTIESTILTRIYPNQKFDATELAEILIGFNALNKGSLDLYFKINENMALVIGNMRLKEYFKVFRIYMSYGPGLEEDLKKSLQDNAVRLAPEFDPFMLNVVHISLIKTFAPDKVISKLEDEVIKKIDSFNLLALSNIAFTYGKYFSDIDKPGKKNTIMVLIEKRLHTSKAQILQENKNENPEAIMIKLMWGLSRASIFNNLKLWKDYGKEIDDNPKVEKSDPLDLLKYVKAYLKYHYVY